MRKVEASAPGKAVLIGEYAVLHGTPALVMAVDRQARVEVRASAPEACRIEAPQLSDEPFAFRITDEGRAVWSDRQAARAELALCRSLLDEALVALDGQALPAPGGFQIRIDSGDLFIQGDDGRVSKLGLGSSAAVTVALSAALKRFLQPGTPELGPSDLEMLLAGHRRSQGGRGSGLDLAAALTGGVIAYRFDRQGAQVRSLVWPEDWPLLFVWVGEAASTGRFLEQYEQWRSQHAAAATGLWQAMDQCARRARTCVANAQLGQFMTCINNYRELMGKIGGCIDVPVISAPHQRLAALALEQCAAYKPCGAGGGDLGLFVASDHEQLARLRRRVVAEGFRELALRPALTGLQLTLTDNHRRPA